jgi:hypothetical protein
MTTPRVGLRGKLKLWQKNGQATLENVKHDLRDYWSLISQTGRLFISVSKRLLQTP